MIDTILLTYISYVKLDSSFLRGSQFPTSGQEGAMERPST